VQERTCLKTLSKDVLLANLSRTGYTRLLTNKIKCRNINVEMYSRQPVDQSVKAGKC